MKRKHLLLTVFFLSLFIFTACSEDDDDSGETQKTTKELIISGKWYFESKTPGAYTTCEKKGYIQFMENGDFILNSFDGDSETCESLGVVTATYTLTNDKNLTLNFDGTSQSAVINSVSDTELKVSNTDTNENLVFDKTEG